MKINILQNSRVKKALLLCGTGSSLLFHVTKELPKATTDNLSTGKQ